MTAGTTIALTLGPAAITGLVSYAVARGQSRLATVQLAADGERMRFEHEEAARERRHATYHSFLTLLYQLDTLVAGFAPQPFDERAFNRWLDEFHQLSGHIDLFGDAGVQDALTGVRTAIDGIGLVAMQAREATFTERFARAYAPRRADVESAVGELIQAMRADRAQQPATAGSR